MNLSTLLETFSALKERLEPLGCTVYSFVPEVPVAPCIILYPGPIPYDVTQGMTVIVWCISGMVDTKGAQERLLAWLDDGPESIVAFIDADPTLGGVVSSIIPIEVRSFGSPPVAEGRPRYWQAELVCDVLQ